MAAPHNVEFEAAKFLQKLIHESTDEPAKLATKLYVILQHMKASGKENSMPYQVISRAMETVINQHGLDIEALMSSRLPLSGGTHAGESARVPPAGCSQTVAVTDSKSGMTENDATRPDGFGSSRPPTGPSSMPEPFQGSVTQRSVRSFDHESPSSMDTRSTNSHSQDRRESASWDQQGTQKDPKRANIKRKRSDSSAIEPPDDSIPHLDSHTGMPDIKESKVEVSGTFPGSSESWKQGFLKGGANFREIAVPGHLSSANQGDVSMQNVNSGPSLDAAAIQSGDDRISQGGIPSNLREAGMFRSSAPVNTGKAPAALSSTASMPFKEHHLKQLRAQCLVFLSFRNGLSPKRPHLEIALGNMLQKEGTSASVYGAHNEPVSDKGKQPTTLESSSVAEVALPRGSLANVKNEKAPMGVVTVGSVQEAAVVKETENIKKMGEKTGRSADPSFIDDGNKHLPPGRGIIEGETQGQEANHSSALLTTSFQPDIPSMRSTPVRVHEDNLLRVGANHGAYVMGMNKQLKPEMSRWTEVAQDDLCQGALPPVQHDLGNRRDGCASLSHHEGDIPNFQLADSNLSTSWKAVQSIESEHFGAKPGNDTTNLLRSASYDGSTALEIQARSMNGLKAVPVSNSSSTHKSYIPVAPTECFLESEEEDKSMSAGLPPSPKYTLSEKWIIAHQKRKLVKDQKWVQKLQKADQRIEACFNELKETVSSSEDISAKTRSVIELKKLQLLELQRRLRRNIMSDFFKPIQTEMDRLKSIKKNRIGRRLKHVEKYEQKMKEERQKRIRERQKEFFSEIEVHKERLEDVFKFKKERCKGFNRYVKEFHKRKERIHREKIDRIQREKINLLKINDVEGYLRMVQDAKSDRVKQLLKETEKYLQKLGSKLQEAKSSARQVETDEDRIATFDEGCEITMEMEDEKDQAKHYKESNEKYYLIAHSIKENITEQPAGLLGGKLREYQMNGLRWLVSLYNNHLNGILADEMGLGKTVQVISLICYLMEMKNDRGPFLVVVPSSVLPGWAQELSFWAPGINKIVYAGPPEERRRLFKESIVQQKFNVLLTTYEYLMNKHDRPKLSKIHWHYVIIDEGHRIKNASCKLNADLKLYRSSHRLLLTGTPLQNNLEELWALLNFLLPNIFNSSEDFSQWFNKPFESNGDNSPDEALLSEEENLLIINRLHQVLRPFVLRRLKHKVENELPEKIERLVRCEASAYQKLLMKRVEDNLGSLGVSKGRAVHNSVMELRNICNHPYLSQLHSEEVDTFVPKHFLPPIVRLCGKLEMLDRLLPKLNATNHRVLFFSTMTRLLDVMEEYLVWKQYRYLRLDGHTSGQDRGALIDQFNQPNSPFFIFLLSIRAGGVGVNLQAADTVIIFDTDWNPQVDLQAQARAHRIGQKKDVLVLRLETVHTVEEQVRAAAEHKLGVANQSITAGFFDNNTSAEDRREYLESLLRECKKEEAAPVLDDDSLNDILARSESEIDVFEAIDQKRREEEMELWKRLAEGVDGPGAVPSLPSRLVTDEDLKEFCDAMKVYDAPIEEPSSSSGVKRKSGSVGGLDTQHYGRGKRAREVRSYEEQWTEEEFEKMCQTEIPDIPKPKDDKIDISLLSDSSKTTCKVEVPLQSLQTPPPPLESSSLVKKEVTPPVKRGRGRPRRTSLDVSPSAGASKSEIQLKETESGVTVPSVLDSHGTAAVTKDVGGGSHQVDDVISPSSKAVAPFPPSPDPASQTTFSPTSFPNQPKRRGRKVQLGDMNMQGQPGTETIRRRGRKPSRGPAAVPDGLQAQNLNLNEQIKQSSTSLSITTSAKVSLDYCNADGPGGTLPKCSDGRAGLTVGNSKTSEVVVTRTDVSLATAVPEPETETSKSIVPCHRQNESAVISSDTSVGNSKINEQPVQQALLESSSVISAPAEPSDVSKVVPETPSGSAVLPLGGSNPPYRTGAELQAVAAQVVVSSSEPSMHSSDGLRPGRRQSKKPQGGNEPVRRRGRKRAQSVSDDPALTGAQNQNSHESLKSIGPVASSTVSYIVPSSGAANVGMGSHVLTVPLIPLVPVSGFVPASTALTGVSGPNTSMGFVPGMPATSQPSPLLSGTPDIPSETPETPISLQVQGQNQRCQGGETAPSRRGRKKSTVSSTGPDYSVGQYPLSRQSEGKGGGSVDRKVIATRSRQIAQSKSAKEEAHTGASFSSRDAMAIGVPNMSSNVFASPIRSASIMTDGASRALEPRHTTTVEGNNLCRSQVNFPPISSKGKTNVIVLALEFSAPTVDSSGIDGRNMLEKLESAEVQKDAAQCVPMLKPEVFGLNVSCAAGAAGAAGAETTKLDEELAAPPGFETPRPYVSDAAVRKPVVGDGGGTPNSPDAKIDSVVLALESVALAIDPSIACKIISEKDEVAVVHTVEESVDGTIVPMKAEGCAEGSESAANAVTPSQTEEEMSAPPGFDIPQLCLSESADGKTLGCNDGQASDMLAGLALNSKVQDYSQASRVLGPNAVGASTLESKEQEEYHANCDGRVGNDAEDAPSASHVDDIEAVSASESKEIGNRLGPDSMPVSDFKSKDEEEPHVPDGDIAECHAGDAPIASQVIGSDAVAALTFGSKEKENCGPDDGNCVDNDGAAPAASSIVGCSDAGAASSLESKECYGPNDGNVEHDAGGDASTISHAGGLETTVASMTYNVKEECQVAANVHLKKSSSSNVQQGFEEKTVVRQQWPSEEVSTDSGTLADTLTESRNHVEDNVGISDVDGDVEMAQATEDAASYPDSSSGNVMDIEQQADENGRVPDLLQKDDTNVPGTEATELGNVNVTCTVENVGNARLEDEKCVKIEGGGLNVGHPDRSKVILVSTVGKSASLIDQTRDYSGAPYVAVDSGLACSVPGTEATEQGNVNASCTVENVTNASSEDEKRVNVDDGGPNVSLPDTSETLLASTVGKSASLIDQTHGVEQSDSDRACSVPQAIEAMTLLSNKKGEESSVCSPISPDGVEQSELLVEGLNSAPMSLSDTDHRECIQPGDALESGKLIDDNASITEVVSRDDSILDMPQASNDGVSVSALKPEACVDINEKNVSMLESATGLIMQIEGNISVVDGGQKDPAVAQPDNVKQDVSLQLEAPQASEEQTACLTDNMDNLASREPAYVESTTAGENIKSDDSVIASEGHDGEGSCSKPDCDGAGTATDVEASDNQVGSQGQDVAQPDNVKQDVSLELEAPQASEEQTTCLTDNMDNLASREPAYLESTTAGENIKSGDSVIASEGEDGDGSCSKPDRDGAGTATDVEASDNQVGSQGQDVAQPDNVKQDVSLQLEAPQASEEQTACLTDNMDNLASREPAYLKSTTAGENIKSGDSVIASEGEDGDGSCSKPDPDGAGTATDVEASDNQVGSQGQDESQGMTD